MKISYISTYDNHGGAAIAASRLFKGIQSQGIEANFITQRKTVSDKNVIGPKNQLEQKLLTFFTLIDRIPLSFYKNRESTPWSLSLAPFNSRVITKIMQTNPDIVHLHWVGNDFIPITKIRKISKPIVWTMHDSWPFTGGCHLPYDCTKYKQECGNCPQLQSNNEKDISRYILRKKKHSWDNLDITVVSPSQWLARKAKNSSLFRNKRIVVIPNGIDTDVFRRIEKKLARKILGLSPDKKYILFGAVNSTSDKNKGFSLLMDCLKVLNDKISNKKTELLIFGNSESENIKDAPFKCRYFGKINDDEKLTLLYSAADVFVCPSLIENLPNTVVESLSCGTPVVAFKVGGLCDIVSHKENGFLAKPFDVSDLSTGILWAINHHNYKMISENSRNTAINKFSIEGSSKKYVNLYRQILS